MRSLRFSQRLHEFIRHFVRSTTLSDGNQPDQCCGWQSAVLLNGRYFTDDIMPLFQEDGEESAADIAGRSGYQDLHREDDAKTRPN